jgi:intracellular sulfur oxidation DsrE/DsrF family protein
MKIIAALVFAFTLALPAAAADWPPKGEPAGITGSLGYAKLPDAVYNPDPKHSYKIVFDVTRAAGKPGEAAPGIALAATELDQLRGNGVPKHKIKLALVFHDDAVNSILGNAAYRAKYKMDNPNLPILAALKAEGVELLVCGQYLVITNTDPATLSPDIAVGSDALLMLATFQNKGYALLSF